MVNSVSYFLCYQGKSIYQMSPEEYDTGEFKVSYSSETNLVKVEIPKKKEEPHFCQFKLDKREKASIIKVGYDENGNAVEKEIVKYLEINHDQSHNPNTSTNN